MVFNRLLNWLGHWRKVNTLPESLWQQTLEGLPFLDRLSVDEKACLRKLSERFLAEKEFTSAGGLELSDAICTSIAVQGCLPILNLGFDCYRDWVGIIVYPDEFIIPRVVEDEIGLVHKYDDIASGEAWDGGPLIISWRDVQMAGKGYNVVIHEFAHKLDMLNGEADGIPSLPTGLPHEEWEKTLLATYDDFCTKVDEAEEQATHDTPYEELLRIDPYASENPAEFFAVLSEIFFETPTVMYEEYPELYALFTRYYHQKPLQCHG